MNTDTCYTSEYARDASRYYKRMSPADRARVDEMVARFVGSEAKRRRVFREAVDVVMRDQKEISPKA